MLGRVVVLGGINHDVFLDVSCFPQLGETLMALNMRTCLGGKGANQAVAAARSGANTLFVGAVGNDAIGEALKKSLQQENIDLSYLSIENDSLTGGAFILVDKNGENQIVVVSGANSKIDAEFVKTVSLTKEDVVVAQLEIPMNVVSSFFSKCRQLDIITILNAAPMQKINKDLLEKTDYLIVNEIELAELMGKQIDTSESAENWLKSAAEYILSASQTLIVTLGAKGAVAWHKSKLIVVEGKPVSVIDTTGAGDCFVGYFAAMLSEGKNVQDAISLANLAASKSVSCRGASASIPYRKQLPV